MTHKYQAGEGILSYQTDRAIRNKKRGDLRLRQTVDSTTAYKYTQFRQWV